MQGDKESKDWPALQLIIAPHPNLKREEERGIKREKERVSEIESERARE